MIRSFRGFQREDATGIFIADYHAEKLVNESKLGKLLNESRGSYTGFHLQETIELLESSGFSSPEHFMILRGDISEGLNVKSEGVRNDRLTINIGGHRYVYKAKDEGIEIAELARKFEKMLQFSAGRALQWLKKNSDLLSGSKKEIDDATDTAIKSEN